MKYKLLTLLFCICLCSVSCERKSSTVDEPNPNEEIDKPDDPKNNDDPENPENPNNYTPDPVGSFAYGVDCSWLTEQEADGIIFRDTTGEQTECMLLMRKHGANAMRLRVWVNHSTGWCNLPDVLVKARRAKALGYRLLIDFHYSDFFTDPSTQTLPAAWKTYSEAELQNAVKEHTAEVLTALLEEDIVPEWVQIGNETRNGMLWPIGRLWDKNGENIEGGWQRYAALQRAGYDAVKTVSPATSVVVHIDNAYQNNNWFFRSLQENGGKFDIIGLSHYPMKKEWSGKDWQEMNSLAISNIKTLYNEFQCPVMLAEIGLLGNPGYANKSYQVAADIMPSLRALNYLVGVFYWEPQVYGSWRPKEYVSLGWEAYDMGAFNANGAPNKALLYLWKH